MIDLTRRYWVGSALGLPVLVLAPMVGIPMHEWISPRVAQWGQLLLATPIVLWCGRPLFVRGAGSIVSRQLDMFTLIALQCG